MIKISMNKLIFETWNTFIKLAMDYFDFQIPLININ